MTFGPFKIIDQDSIYAEKRNYSCSNYANCLSVAAALNWEGFYCNNCSGEMNKALGWRAIQAQKNDKVAKKICKFPKIRLIKDDDIDQVA